MDLGSERVKRESNATFSHRAENSHSTNRQMDLQAIAEFQFKRNCPRRRRRGCLDSMFFVVVVFFFHAVSTCPRMVCTGLLTSSFMTIFKKLAHILAMSY